MRLKAAPSEQRLSPHFSPLFHILFLPSPPLPPSQAVCFLVDPLKGGRVAFVQFPQRFDGVDRNDRYANHNTVFYDVRRGSASSCEEEDK